MRNFALALTLAAGAVSSPAAAANITLFDSMNRTAGPVVYNCCQAWGVEGPQNWFPGSGGGIESRIAVAFTPAVNASVIEIDAAVSYYYGPNGVVLGIYADDHDKPGRLMRSWTFNNTLAPLGTCCSYLAATWPNGIPVVAGRQYWIVARTDASMLDTISSWNQTSVQPTAVRHIERWCGDNQLPGGTPCAPTWVNGQWNHEDGAPAPALAVIGQI